MSDYDGKVNGEVVLNLADWIERRRDAVGPYADHIIHSVRSHEAELVRLRAEVERLTAALADERAHADVMAKAAGALDSHAVAIHDADGKCYSVRATDYARLFDAIAQHRARRQGAKLP
ncbi:hypothetical protein E3U26_12445 [Paracoccus ferrooxidans]|nr:hypothetical protein E3U26_12445 [Paracoccus ferrooxidans]